MTRTESLGILLFEHFLLEAVGLCEFDIHFVVGQFVVNRSHGFQLGGDLVLVERIQEQLDVLLSIQSNSSLLSNQVRGVQDIVEDVLVNLGESSASGNLLGSVSLCSLGDDGSLGNDNHGPHELLLQMGDDFLTHLSVSLQRPVGDANKESLAEIVVLLLVFNKLGTYDQHLSQVAFHLTLRLHFQLIDRLSNFFFKIGGLGVFFFHEFTSSVEHPLFNNE